MRRPPARVLVVLLPGFLLLAACGDDGGGEADEASGSGSASTASSGEDEDQDQSEDPDEEEGGSSACDLLSTDEVAELLGRDVEDGEESEIGEGATSCEWATVEPSEAVDEPITLEVEVGPLSDEISGRLDEAIADEANEPLDLGDRGVLVCGLGADGDDCSSFDSVSAAVGEQYLEVDLSNWGYPQDYSEEEGDQITLDAAERVVDALA